MRDSDPLLSLLVSPDPAQARQGIALAAAQGDLDWFDDLFRPVTYRDTSDAREIGHAFRGTALRWWAVLGLLLRAPAKSQEAARLRGQVTSLSVQPKDGIFPEYPLLAGLPNLRALYLGKQGGLDLGVLAALPRLERLILFLCPGIRLDSVRLPALRRLDLSHLDLASLAGLEAPALEILSLEGRSPLESLAGLRAPGLRRVEIRAQQSQVFSFRGEFPRLEVIRLHNEPCAPRDLARLQGLRALEADLRGALPDLPPGLERLALRIREEALDVAGLPALRELSLRGLGGTRAARLAELPQLERLALQQVEVAGGLEGLPRLRSLEIEYRRASEFASLPRPELYAPYREPRPLALPPQLRALRLRAPRLPPALPADLEELALRLGDEPASLEPLRPLRRLRILSLWDVPDPRDLAILADLPALAEVRVRPAVAPRLPALAPRVRVVSE